VITREELYELVWTFPGKVAAAKLSVSDVYLAKVCRALRVPRPERGQWRKIEKNKDFQRPPLPPPHPGHPRVWRRPSEGMSTPLKPFYVRNATADELIMRSHMLLDAGREGDGEGYLAPRRGGSLDIVVTRAALERALCVFRQMIDSFAACGHSIKVISSRAKFTRPPVDPRFGEDRRIPIRDQFREPFSITVAEFDSGIIGLLLLETCALTEMRYIGYGRFEPAAKRSKESVRGNTWTQLSWFPTGKFEILAYTNTSRFQRLWTEMDEGSLPISAARLLELVKSEMTLT